MVVIFGTGCNPSWSLPNISRSRRCCEVMGDTNLHVGRLPPGDWKQDGEGGRDEKRKVDKGEGKGRGKREERKVEYI